MKRPGQLVGQEMWIRCPFCGDSERRQDVAHFSVRRDGRYHCFRCGVGGRFKTSDYFKLLIPLLAAGADLDDAPMDDQQVMAELEQQLLPGPGSERDSALERNHLKTRTGMLDVFRSRSASGDQVGLLGVDPATRRRQMWGVRAIGWVGDRLLSTPEEPLRLVEGPYDVLDERTVCAFGTPSRKTFRNLRGQYIIACPDGDIWIEPTKRRLFLEAILCDEANIVGVEVLPPDLDPDQVPVLHRDMYTLQEVIDAALDHDSGRTRWVGKDDPRGKVLRALRLATAADGRTTQQAS